MEKDYIMNNTGVSRWTEPSCGADQSFLESSHDQFSQLNSSLQSNDTFALCKLIGKLGSGMGTPAAFPAAESSNFASATTDCSSLASCKLNLPILDPMSISNLVSSATLAPPLPSLAADPGFAERAAKFSCFGSRSFNGRSPPQLVLSSNLYSEGNGKLSRVSSNPVIKQGGSGSRKSGQMEMHRHSTANEDSPVSEQMQTGETGSKISNELSSRKRKSAKTREDGSNSDKVVKGGENKNAKRSKQNGGGKIEAQTKEETKGAPNDESEKQKANQKPPEPPKDYIHVRARRGQATDSHSLAERVRREKISERMKLLQDLVPGCNKVTGKALMLDEIINYVQSLQRQVEFLSMKLASVNPGLDFNIENLLSKDMFQQNAVTLPQQMYPLDSSSPAFYQPNVHHNHSNGANISVGPLSQCPVDPLPVHARHLGIHLPTVELFNETLPQFPSFSEDELQSIVQMGIVPSPTKFPVSNPMPNMKVER